MTQCQELIQQFKQQGYKMTPQRRAILNVLAGPESHLTVEQIHEQVRQDMPDTSLATVYNMMRELVGTGVLRELELGNGGRRYEIAQEKHAHAVCLSCGRVEDLPGDWSALESLFPPCHDFCPASYQVTIQGYCAKCVTASAVSAVTDIGATLD